MLKNFGVNLLVLSGAFVLLTVFSVVFSDIFLYPFLIMQEKHPNITTQVLLALLAMWIGIKIFLALRKTEVNDTNFFRRAFQAVKSLGRTLLKANVYILIAVLGFVFLLFVLQLNQNVLTKLVTH